MKTKKLIINADDFGVSEDINEGIIECYRRGVVTDVSLLACGPHFDHAVALARENNINRVGIHIALTGAFKAISPHAHISALVNRKGFFHKSFPVLLAKFIVGRIKKSQIHKECKAQVVKVKEAGLLISHLDSHEHIHMFGPILKIVLRVMKEEGVRAIRFPKEKVSLWNLLKEPRNAVRHLSLVFVCNMAKRVLCDPDITHNKYFTGHFHAHRLNEKDFFSILSHMKEGITELGCHPGYFGRHIAAERPWYKGCEEEMRVLCDMEFRKEIKRWGIKLASYADNLK